MKKLLFYKPLLLLFFAGTLVAIPHVKKKESISIKLDPSIVHLFVIEQQACMIEQSIDNLLHRANQNYPPSRSMDIQTLQYKARLRSLKRQIDIIKNSLKNMPIE